MQRFVHVSVAILLKLSFRSDLPQSCLLPHAAPCPMVIPPALDQAPDQAGEKSDSDRWSTTADDGEDGPPLQEQPWETRGEERYCRPCDTWLHGPLQWTDHLITRKHIKNKNKFRVAQVLVPHTEAEDRPEPGYTGDRPQPEVEDTPEPEPEQAHDFPEWVIINVESGPETDPAGEYFPASITTR